MASSLCALAESNFGCSPFCGFEGISAGSTSLCLPSSRPEFNRFSDFPPLSLGRSLALSESELESLSETVPVSEEDRQELCLLNQQQHRGCSSECGFVWSERHAECKHFSALQKEHEPQTELAHGLGDAPIIGGSGKFRYQYMPDLVQAPEGAVMVNCHGLALDKDNNIILTYQNDKKTDSHCLIRWNPDGTGGEFVGNETAGLCGGVPHGLKITTEQNAQGQPEQFLYHANNAQLLAKTTLDGQAVWMRQGNFGQNDTCTPDTCPENSCRCTNGKAPYIPTWFAVPPDSDYMYLCDGYGSDHVYAFERATGTYMNKSWAGRSPAGLTPGAAGPTQPHGLFMENHGCTYDPRNTTSPNTIVVSDRRNMRFEFFHYDPKGYETFEWYQTVDMSKSLGPNTLPCNMRMYPDQDGRSIVPDLAGPVAVLDNQHNVLSVVNVSVLLAAEQHLHPHDAVFLPNGDMVVATWAPGRISYWKLLPEQEPTPCGIAAENVALEIGCPGGTGKVIESVRFASFGTPTGNCTYGFSHNPACNDINATATLDYITATCVGKTHCTVVGSDDVLGDGCVNTLKSLAVEVACSA